MLSSLLHPKSLYHQAILSSGNAVVTTRTLNHQNRIYEMFIEHLSIPSNLPPHERLDRLRSVSVDELLDAYQCTGSPMPNWQATVDGNLLHDLPAASQLPHYTYPSTIRRIMVGDCEKEVRPPFARGQYLLFSIQGKVADLNNA